MKKAKSKKIIDNSASAEQARYEKLLPPARHKPGSSVTLVIDGMNLAYQAYYAYSRLSYHGKSVAMIFGFPQMLKSLIIQHKPTKVIVCWDGFKHPKRVEWVPGYKLHREERRDPKQRERFFKEIKTLRLLLYSMGITQAYNTKVEGDDMICLIANKEVKLNKVIIISGDKDMLQLVNWDITVINPRPGSKYISIHTPWSFSIGTDGVELHRMVDYLCLVGDDSDDIEGIRGIGPVKARQFLKLYPTMNHYFEDEDETFIGMIDKEKALKRIKRNKRMIDLQWFCQKYYKAKHITYYKDKAFLQFKENLYTRICKKYNLKTMLIEAFKKPFK